MENLKFDSEQKQDGVNKHGHYQFGSQTCQFCKNPDTELKDGIRYCYMCKGEARH